MKRNVKSTQRLVRELTAKVDTSGGGTLTRGGNDFTLARTGTGDVTLTPVLPGTRILHCTVQAVADAGNLYATLHSSTGPTAARVKLWTTANAAADGVFYLRMVLSDTADET